MIVELSDIVNIFIHHISYNASNNHFQHPDPVPLGMGIPFLEVFPLATILERTVVI